MKKKIILKHKAIFISLILMVAVTGCGPSFSKFKVDGAKLPQSEANKILGIIEQSHRIQLPTKALVTTVLQKGKHHERFREILAVKPPSSFLIQFIPINSAFNLATLTVHKGILTYIDSMERKVVTGPVSPMLIKRFTGVEVNPIDVGYLLSGSVPPSCFLQESGLNTAVYNLPGSKTNTVVRGNNQFICQISINGEKPILNSFLIRDPFSDLNKISIKYIRDEGENRLLNIVIESHNDNVSLVLTVQDFKFVDSIDDELFEKTAPTNYNLEQVN